jgi:hypothetical protein
MSLGRSPHDVLHVTHTLQKLQDKWSADNRSRIFKQTESQVRENALSSPVEATSVSNKASLVSQVLVSSRVNPRTNASAIASYQQVVVSRSDLPSSVTSRENTHVSVSNQSNIRSDGKVKMSEQDYAHAMAGTEKEIITSVCNIFLSENPPYSGVSAAMKQSPPVASFNPSTGANDIVSHTCCAYVTTIGANTSKRIYLPMAAPTREQITICGENDVYNKNIQHSITSALEIEHVPIIRSSCTGSLEHGTVQLNPNTVIKALGTTACCEDLLFGKCRITSSPNFCIDMDVGATYANAVRKYQQYANVAIGEQITLVPMIHKRAPMIVSMSCPSLNISDVITSVSGQQTHSRFGPNHPARAVEVLAKIMPFVQRCCEVSMDLPTETVEDLKEDSDMPTPICKSVEHCFSHSATHGVGAYVATHVFSLPTAILNTHLVGHNVHSSDSCNKGLTTGSSAGNNPFPLEQEITIHVTALFGGAVTDRSVA